MLGIMYIRLNGSYIALGHHSMIHRNAVVVMGGGARGVGGGGPIHNMT